MTVYELFKIYDGECEIYNLRDECLHIGYLQSISSKLLDKRVTKIENASFQNGKVNILIIYVE